MRRPKTGGPRELRIVRMGRDYFGAYLACAGTRPRGGDLIDPHYRKVAPLIPLALTCEIPERIGFDGGVLRPLDREAVRAAARRLKQVGCQAIAICFLFSFLRDDHEPDAAEIIRSECPDIRVSQKARLYNPCARNELSPFSQEGTMAQALRARPL